MHIITFATQHAQHAKRRPTRIRETATVIARLSLAIHPDIAMSTQPAPAAAPATAATTLSISQQIAEFAANLTPDAIPADVRERAKLHALDVAGTALAATRFDFAQHALAGIRQVQRHGCRQRGLANAALAGKKHVPGGRLQQAQRRCIGALMRHAA